MEENEKTVLVLPHSLATLAGYHGHRVSNVRLQEVAGKPALYFVVHLDELDPDRPPEMPDPPTLQ